MVKVPGTDLFFFAFFFFLNAFMDQTVSPPQFQPKLKGQVNVRLEDLTNKYTGWLGKFEFQRHSE